MCSTAWSVSEISSCHRSLDRIDNPLAGLDAGLIEVLAAVEEGAATPDQVAVRVGRPPGAVAADLSRLELKGRVRADALGRYARAFDGVP